MFVHQSQLEHLLRPADYFSPQQFAVEIERLFRLAWFVVAARAELARPGAFITCDLLGTPIIVRNFDGELRAFLNVCAHRHAKLTCVERGCSERLRCQYHGWEYKADGYTAHIPEARIFRPLDRETARLESLRLATAGDLVFVSLASDGPSLADQLGSFLTTADDWFNAQFRFAGQWRSAAPANWKVLVENGVESYHVPLVHPVSFGVAPAEEICRHELNEHSSTFHSDETLAWRRRGQSILVRSLGLPVTNIYTHHLAYPHLQFVRTDLVRIAIMVVPTSPTTCEQRVWVFAPQGVARNPWAWLIRQIMGRVVMFETRRVLGEDARIFAAVQQGLEASPLRGVIGTREERVYAFQRYVQRYTASQAEAIPNSGQGRGEAPTVRDVRE
jgi:phenylpropionate dioxygenase-like ring-hydroxylating dioxygenase large terminal subunit